MLFFPQLPWSAILFGFTWSFLYPLFFGEGLSDLILQKLSKQKLTPPTIFLKITSFDSWLTFDQAETPRVI